ncbi:glycosyl hydrolase family 18 protein [Streptomyces sp. NBC_00320]|uniref:glycosyl hydrolase family 18 protein n=1 Tax=unclassified Streptomyces TaxID=2593676 RepID=UPI0022546C4C|nr:glycosyl hydrolase family 18 protein [Streptomyces sp. NBC_00320]MCX5151721.1 glycosyl hydrolase family 18 protein [Streptomyces sp. NBC_00320]
MKNALTGLLAAAVLTLSGAAPAPPSAEPPAPARTVSAWLPWWNIEAGYQDALAHADQLHTVSPFWYATSGESAVKGETGAGDRRIVDGLRAKGIKVVPTVTESLGAPAMAALLHDPARRAAHVEALLDIATSRRYDGLDLDYERMTETEDTVLREQVRTGYNALTTELCARLHALAKQCVITVMPRTRDSGQAFDYAHLGSVADRLRIMGYNLHNALQAPGPLSSLAWYEEFLAYATANVPRGKLEVALPAYGWNWTVGSTARAGHVTTREAEALRRAVGAQYTYDTASGTPHFTYTDDEGERHEVWYQDARGSAAHLEVLARFEVRAPGLWALGFEDPALWKTLAAERPTRTAPTDFR